MEARAWALGMMFAWALGCNAAPGLFSCQTDQQCVSGEATGACQPSGYCSFGDPACPSGQRYSQSAPSGLAGTCVEPSEASSGGSSSATSTTAASTSATSTSATSSVATSTRGTSTTSDLTASDSGVRTDSDTREASSGDDSTSDSSGVPPTTTTPLLCPEFVDEFDNAVLDESPWTWVPNDAPLMSESGGVLRYSVSATTPGYGTLELTGEDLSNGYVVVHLVALPQENASQFSLRVGPSGSPSHVSMLVSDQADLAVRTDSILQQVIEISPPPTELWLEIYVDAGEVFFLYSVDGDRFIELFSEPVTFNYSNVSVSLTGGSYQPLSGAGHSIEVDDFEFCSSPIGT